MKQIKSLPLYYSICLLFKQPDINILFHLQLEKNLYLLPERSPDLGGRAKPGPN